MEITETEFKSLTDKLERYAAQLSGLETRMELQSEIEELRKEQEGRAEAYREIGGLGIKALFSIFSLYFTKKFLYLQAI